jgi:ATP-dependent DNA helicase RecQ
VAVVLAPAYSVEAKANRALAEHIAAVGKLPLLDMFTWTGGETPFDTARVEIVAHLERAIHLDPGLGIPEGPGLLCATTMRSGWSITVAAALLHDNGCHTTMPLVLHRLP